MKKTALFVVIVACAIAGAWAYANCDSKETTGQIPTFQEIGTNPIALSKNAKVLVAYFTVPETDGVDASSGASRIIDNGQLYGNTEYVARIISEATGGDLFAIKTVQTYPGGHKELVDAAKKEAEAKARPKLVSHIKNLKDYDVVFVGYPNWWYDMPMPLYTFFEEYDFSGKTVIPFCTHGGSRFSQSVKTITELEKNATVIQGPSASRDNMSTAKDNVLKWLQKQGLNKD